jgi:hypothetical protein
MPAEPALLAYTVMACADGAIAARASPANNSTRFPDDMNFMDNIRFYERTALPQDEK